jgi:hypothetical protein
MGITKKPSSSRPRGGDRGGKRPRRSASAPVPLGRDSSLVLVVLSVKQKAACCRFLGATDTFTFQANSPSDLVPGEIVIVSHVKQWTSAGSAYVSGTIDSIHVDAKALGLTPLRLEELDLWNPAEHYWGEQGELIEDWAKPVIARGPRLQFGMESILPGLNPQDPFYDPIGESLNRRNAGDKEGAYQILMDLCQADLRCLDAHAHLGSFVFDRRPEDAIRYFDVGFRIGELSLGDEFDGLLPWVWLDNRPFLRCMHGFGLCLWRLGLFKEALNILDRMLWLNPSDNQGVRFLIDDVRTKRTWNASQHG